MELKELIEERINENIPRYDLDRIEGYKYLIEMIATEYHKEQLALFSDSNTEGKSQAVEDLVEFARNNCREWNVEEMEEILDRL